MKTLQIASKWQTKGKEPKVGEIVLLEHPNLRSRILWDLGKILELYPGRDGLVRSVKLLSRGKELTRHLNYIYRLEANND